MGRQAPPSRHRQRERPSRPGRDRDRRGRPRLRARARLAAALAADPAAGRFFDSLAQFYRKAYLRWIDGTRRSPHLRAERIAAVIGFLAEGRKTRPGG